MAVTENARPACARGDMLAHGPLARGAKVGGLSDPFKLQKRT